LNRSYPALYEGLLELGNLEIIVQVSDGCCGSPGRESGPGTGTVPVAASAAPELPGRGTRGVATVGLG